MLVIAGHPVGTDVNDDMSGLEDRLRPEFLDLPACGSDDTSYSDYAEKFADCARELFRQVEHTPTKDF